MLIDQRPVNPFSDFDDDRFVDTCGADQAIRTRGVVCVLRWAAALAILFLCGGVLMEFAYCLAAEHTLARAARAGALEATLPRATTKSVAETVARRLTNDASATGRTHVVLKLNGTPMVGRWIARPGDRVAVIVTVPSTAVLPQWLQRVTLWHDNPPIEARAERDVPGKTIRGRES